MGLSDLVQKAVYIGIGAASYAGEKAGSKLTELSGQLQKLTNEMVERGEMTAEEARRYVDEKMKMAQQELENFAPPGTQQSPKADAPGQPKEPRRIEIIDEDETPVAKSEGVKSEAVKSEGVKSGGVKPESAKSETGQSQKLDNPIDDMRRQVAELQDELRRLRS